MMCSCPISVLSQLQISMITCQCTIMVLVLPVLLLLKRSFSAPMRNKSYLRPTMTEQRLTDLVVLSIKRKLSAQLSMDYVMDHFTSMDRNRKKIVVLQVVLLPCESLGTRIFARVNLFAKPLWFI